MKKESLKKESLTAKQVEHARPGSERREIAAGDGLYLIVNPTGMKSWAYRYRWLGKPRKLTLGSYPEMKLAPARAAADAARADLDNDKDPAAVKAEEDAQEPGGIAAVAEEWLTRYVKLNTREKSQAEFERIVRREMIPAWKHKRITDLMKPDVLRLLDGIVDRGAGVMANCVFEVVRLWLNWCVERGYIVASPASGVKPPTAEQSRDRVLTPNELTEVWNAAESFHYPGGLFTQFLILTAQRRGEVGTMRWRDVDLDKGLWTLPKEATKSGRVHDVPLSAAALAILKALPRFTYIDKDGKEKQGPFVWTTTSGRQPINGFSKLKSRIDKETLKRRTAAGIEKNIASWTMHDLRRTAATHMAEAGVAPHVLAAIMNHTPGSTQGVTSIYNRFKYSEERRAALQAWSEFVLSLNTPATKAATA